MINRISRLRLSIVLNLSLRIFSIFINFLIVRVLLTYLGVDKYGIWVTISVLVNWFNLFDVGLGQGLKLKLTNSFSRVRIKNTIKLISSSYFLTTAISFFLLLLLIIFNSLSSWSNILNLSNAFDNEVNTSINILFFLFIPLFVVKLIGIVYASLQLPFVDNIIKITAQFVFFVSILVYYKLNFEPNLILVSISSLLPLVIIYCIFNFYIFKIKTPVLFPKVKSISIQSIKELASPSISFFVIQIGCIILYSTDNFIILQLLEPSDVATYNIFYKLYSAPFIFFNIYVSSHWSSFIDAISNEDYHWIRLKVFSFLKVLTTLVVFYVFMFFLEENLLNIWLPNFIYNKSNLSIHLIIYFLISSLTTIYVYVINSFGKLRIQLWSYVIIAIINIPLSVYFVKYLKFGISGVINASSFCLLILLILMPIQYLKIIKKKDSGIWSK